MAIYIITAILCVGLACMVHNHPLVSADGITRQRLCGGICLFGIFLVLFGLSACRLDVGNDYIAYVDFMHLASRWAYVPTEPGFNWLARIVYFLSGYENYLLVFAIYAFVTVALFLAAMYEQSDSFPLTFFLFMMLGYYFQSFSMVRYYLALAIALYSMKYVLRRQWGKFILLILLGALFHKSILVVLPLYFLASLPWKKWQLLIPAAFCVSCLFLQDFYLKVVVFLYPSYEDTEYLVGGTSYINILRCLAVLVFSLCYYKKCIRGNRRLMFYFYLNLGALALYVFCGFLPVISRIGYYLTVSHILFLPALLRETQSKKLRRVLYAGVCAVAVLYFAVFLMKASDDGIRLLPYQTFFFHDLGLIPSDTA